MARMLDLATLRGRVQGYLVYLSQQDEAVRLETGPALTTCFSREPWRAGSSSR